MAKYVFVTGGVVSSVGKGVCAARNAELKYTRSLNKPKMNIHP